jgi:type IV pilus biogenesis protein CpaD/CtpE
MQKKTLLPDPGLRTRAARVLLGLALAALGAGCAKPHLTATYGRATREAFARQMVNPAGKADSRGITALDSQEAALVTAAYRRTTAPRGTSPRENQSMIILTPSAEASTGSSYVPPPSAPPGK